MGALPQQHWAHLSVVGLSRSSIYTYRSTTFSLSFFNHHRLPFCLGSPGLSRGLRSACGTVTSPDTCEYEAASDRDGSVVRQFFECCTSLRRVFNLSIMTNKLGTASGEIQPDSNGTRPTTLERSSSTPPTNGAPVRPQGHPAPSAPVVPRVSSNLRTSTASPSMPEPDVEDEDFGDGWGDMDDEQTADAVADAWGSEEATTSRPSTASKPSVSYDDGGEPDFEGWLNAQAAAKSKSKVRCRKVWRRRRRLRRSRR